jgi:hypothetical protein
MDRTQHSRATRDRDFPCAGFVRQAMEGHLAEFERDETCGVDLAWSNPDSGVRWIVEVRGGRDLARPEFQAGLSQLLAHMDMGPHVNYCLALPDTDEFLSLCKEIPWRVRRTLNLWLFLVGEDGVVDAILPAEAADPAESTTHDNDGYVNSGG